jgi:hypothetical protein
VGCFSHKFYRLFQTQHSFSVTIFTLGFRLFFILLQIHLDTQEKPSFEDFFFPKGKNKKLTVHQEGRQRGSEAG